MLLACKIRANRLLAPHDLLKRPTFSPSSQSWSKTLSKRRAAGEARQPMQRNDVSN